GGVVDRSQLSGLPGELLMPSVQVGDVVGDDHRSDPATLVLAQSPGVDDQPPLSLRRGMPWRRYPGCPVIGWRRLNGWRVKEERKFLGSLLGGCEEAGH